MIDKGVVFDGGCHMLNGAAAAEPASFKEARRRGWQPQRAKPHDAEA